MRAKHRARRLKQFITRYSADAYRKPTEALVELGNDVLRGAKYANVCIHATADPLQRSEKSSILSLGRLIKRIDQQGAHIGKIVHIPAYQRQSSINRGCCDPCIAFGFRIGDVEAGADQRHCAR